MTIEVNSKVDKVIDEVQAKRIRALTAGGIIVEREAKKLAPVGTPESTGIPNYIGGSLKNSITFKVDADAKHVTIGAGVEYAPYVELGTYKMKARPYLMPAILDHLEEIADAFRKELGS